MPPAPPGIGAGLPVNQENEVLSLENRIKNRVKKQMEKTQREYYLNEQMRAIQKEMGDKEDLKGEIQELERRLRKKRMSAEAAGKVKHELKKLKLMSPMSAEATVSRNYIDWLLSLPWGEKTKDNHDIKRPSASSTKTTMAWKSPRSASSNTWRSRAW
jgi:ATP-dependent Lon protease